VEAANPVAALRRKAVVTAACCAILGGFVPLALHQHRWLAFVCIGAQVILLVTAIRLYLLSNQTATRAATKPATARK
jgi:hypothetical protein